MQEKRAWSRTLRSVREHRAATAAAGDAQDLGSCRWGRRASCTGEDKSKKKFCALDDILGFRWILEGLDDEAERKRDSETLH